MEWELLFAGISLLTLAVLTIAGTSIATECYNENKDFADKKKSNYNFLIINLASAVLVVILAIVSIYFAFTKKPKVITVVSTPVAVAPKPVQAGGAWRMKRK